MNSRMVFILAFALLLVGTTSAWQKSDFVKLIENTDACLTDCHTVYQLTNPTNVDYTITDNSKFAIRFVQKYLGDLDDYSLFLNSSVSKVVNVTDFGQCSFGNGTKYSCITGYHNETRMQEVWTPFTPIGTTFTRRTAYKLMVVGKKELGANIDNIISYGGYDFPEYAWWNTTWFSCVNLTSTESMARINAITRVQVNCSNDVSCQWGRLVNSTCQNGGSQVGSLLDNVSTSGTLLNVTFVDTGANYSWYFNNVSGVGYDFPPAAILDHDEFNSTFNVTGLWSSTGDCTTPAMAGGILRTTCSDVSATGITTVKTYDHTALVLQTRVAYTVKPGSQAALFYKNGAPQAYTGIFPDNNSIRLFSSVGSSSGTYTGSTYAIDTWYDFFMEGNTTAGKVAVSNYSMVYVSNINWQVTDLKVMVGGIISGAASGENFTYLRIWNGGLVNTTTAPRNFTQSGMINNTGTTVTMYSPNQSSYLNTNVTLNFSVTDLEFAALPCWKTFDAVTTYFGNVSINTYQIDYLNSPLGQHWVQITCQSGGDNFTSNNKSYIVSLNYTMAVVYDELTMEALTFNLTIANSTLSQTYTGLTSFGRSLTTLPSGSVTVTIVNYSGGYYPRTYYANLNGSSSVNETGFLLKIVDGQLVRFHIVTIAQVPIPNAVVTAWKLINFSYASVGEATADSSGTASIFLNPATTYLFQVDATGYAQQNFSITPSGTDYTFTLAGTTANVSFLFQDVNYSLSPYLLSMNRTLNPVSLSVVAVNANLEFWGLNVSYAGDWIYNNTQAGSSGGTINLILDNSARTGNVTLVVFIKKVNYGLWSTNYTYQIYNQTVVSNYSLTNLANSLRANLKFSPDYAIPILCLVIAAFVAVFIAGYSFVGAGLIALAILGIFTAIGFFDAWMFELMAVVGIGFTVLRMREV